MEVDRERKKSSDRLDSARKRNPVRDAFRTTWELGRCPFPPPSTRGNRISVSRAIGARVSARKATFIRHSSEKPRVVVVGRLLFCLVVALRRFVGRKEGGGDILLLSQVPIAFCLAPRVSYVQRHLEYNATGGTRIKSTARRLPPLREWTREAKKSIAACRRSVSPELPFQVR